MVAVSIWSIWSIWSMTSCSEVSLATTTLPQWGCSSKSPSGRRLGSDRNFGNTDLPRFHQCHLHSKRHLCDRCVTVSQCTEDDKSKGCVLRGSKATGTTAKPSSGRRTGSHNRGIYLKSVCVLTFLLCAAVEVTLSGTCMKGHPSGEGAGAVFELG